MYSIYDLKSLSADFPRPMGLLTTYSRLEIDQDGSWNISRVVALVEEDVFSVGAFCCKILEIAVLPNAVLLAKLLPELAAN